MTQIAKQRLICRVLLFVIDLQQGFQNKMFALLSLGKSKLLLQMANQFKKL